jgi:thiol-disulfide isomerase/thioredoxin
MKYLLLISLILTGRGSEIKNNFIILNGNIENLNIKFITVYSTIKNATSFSFDETNNLKVDDNGKFNVRLNLAEPRTLFIKCAGRTHEIFVQPGDSVFFTFSKTNRPDTINSEFLKLVSIEKLALSGNNKYQFAFFDSIENKTGLLYQSPDNMKNDPATQKKIIDSIYQLRINYLNVYTEKYHLTQNFKKVAYDEIRGGYIQCLISRLFHFNRSEFPNNYFSEIKNERFTWERCSHARLYMAAARSYCTYYLRTSPFGGATDEDNLKEQFTVIKKIFLDENLKNYFLTFLMNDYLERQPKNYEVIYNEYMSTCSKQLYKDAITSRYKKSIELNSSVLPAEVLHNTRLIRASDNKNVGFDEIVKTQKNQYVLFDFWASWCGPCLLQIPYLKPFEEKFSKKISIVFMSLDRSLNAFENSKKTLNIKGDQYFLKDGFNSPLAVFIKMKSIPRYIVVDKTLHLIKEETPLPTNKTAFTKTLNDLD